MLSGYAERPALARAGSKWTTAVQLAVTSPLGLHLWEVFVFAIPKELSFKDNPGPAADCVPALHKLRGAPPRVPEHAGNPGEVPPVPRKRVRHSPVPEPHR